MDITPLVPKGRQLISSYGNGGFKITEQSLHGSILIAHDQVLSWPVSDMAQVTAESVSVLFSQTIKPEIVVIGTGKTHLQMDSSLRQWFRSQGVAVEIMDTGAACRTYNVLLTEGRNVSAALIAV